MGKTFKKILCSLLVVVMCLTSAPLDGFVGWKFNAEAATYKVGDIIEFGEYPQTQVQNATLIETLNQQDFTMASYNYSVNNENSDFMRYADIEFQGSKYRAVIFDECRPSRVNWGHSDIQSGFDMAARQLMYGYKKGVVYWFKYEPIKWIVLNPTTNLVISKDVIDSQPFTKTCYSRPSDGIGSYSDPACTKVANTYSTSWIKTWLNTIFKDWAFSSKQQGFLKEINLPSVSQVKTGTPYFVDGYHRRAYSSDYAKSQGLDYYSSEYVDWLLRDKGFGDIYCYAVWPGGGYESTNAIASATDNGIRPIIKLSSLPDKAKYYTEPTAPYDMNKLKSGDTIHLSAFKEFMGEKNRLYGVSWHTTNAAVASVTSAGVVTIKDKGLAQIYFKYNNNKSTVVPIISNGCIVTDDFNILRPETEAMPTLDPKGQAILDKTGFDITEILSNISLDGGKLKGPTVTIAGQEVTLFEFDVGAEFPLLEGTTIVVDTKEKRIKVGIGIKENSSAQVGKAGQKTTYWSESYKEVKNLYQKATGKKVTTTKLWNDFSALRGRLKKINGKMALNCDTYLAGYLEFSYSKNSYEFVEGGVLAECNFGATVESRWPSFPAAYTVFGVTAGAHGDLTVKVKDYKSSYTGNIGGNLKASYGVGLGEKKVSDTYIEGGMEATLNVNFAFPASSLKNSLTVEMTGDFYVTAKALGYELYSDVFPFADFQLYPSFQQNRRMMMLRNVSATELEKTATPIDRDYTTDESKIDIAEDTFKKSDLYAFNTPTLVQLSNNKQMLVWVDDDGTKSSINRTTLYYSIFNGSAWSMPDIVFESKGYNGTPVVVSDGTNVHILWSMSPEMSAADGYTELVKSLDLFYIKYNGSIFEEPIQITTANDIQEFSYDMTLVGSDVYITWLENSDNNSMMGTGKNSLKTANIVNGALSDVNTIIETSDFITGTTMLAEDTLSYYIITESDSGSKLLEFKEGIETELRNIPERMSQLDTFNNLITFVEDSRLIKYNGETFYAFNMDNVDNYEFVTNGTETAVITLVQGANGSEKMMASYHNEEDNTWTAFVPLLDDGTYIRNYSAIMNSEGEILAAVNSVEVNENSAVDGRYGKATLFVLNGSNYFDLAIGEYLYKNKNEEGEDELLFEVTNLSSTTLESITVDIVDTAGGNATMDIPCELVAGETKEFSVVYEGLTSIGQKDVTVTVSNRAYVENNLVNNSIATTIGYADLVVEDLVKMYEGCTPTICFNIVNRGFSTAENIIVDFIDTLETNKVLNTFLIKKLEPQKDEKITIVVPKEYLHSTTEDIYNSLAISITTDSIEENTENNKELLVYYDYSELSENSAKHSLSLIGTVEATCTDEGIETYGCSECDYTETRTLYPTYHMYNSEYFDEIPATCKEPGYTWGEYCYDCKTWVYGHEEIDIDSTNHPNKKIDIFWDATCEESGFMKGVYCPDCKVWIEGAGTIEPKGHDYEGDICKTCGESKVDNCTCICHSTGVMSVVWKLLTIAFKFFKANPVCECGQPHY